ncbi:hypothetical protein [Rufibacter tibetensis]|uniref:hypothetical protein n=1 Tax=Rufibacter tibetensis TaxID=512763 RepID=UPI0007862F11|nr:hypothetical protein [Rufibacter tibetensis]
MKESYLNKTKALVWLLLCFLPFPSWAQLPAITVEGFFLRDSVELGQSIKYVLLSRHSPQAEVIFPDTSARFAPFELVRKDFFPTRTVKGISTDSTVYTLRTFTLKPIQSLQLTAQLFFSGDTLNLTTPRDSVVLIQNVTTVQEPLLLKSATQLRPVPEQFNYLYWALGAVAASILIGGVWALFGKGINLRYKLYVLQKDQAQFQSRFQTSRERFQRGKTLDQLERAIILWKNYLTKLEDTAINSFTTKEIVTYYDEDERVSNALKVCDRAIYGNIISDDEAEETFALNQLADFSASRYVLIRDYLRNVASSR